MQLHREPEWQRALNQYVEVQRNGRIVRDGIVEAVMPDGSILWLSAAGVDSRVMVEREDGTEIYTRYS